MFDIITIGTAAKDVFLKLPGARIIRDKKELEHLHISIAEAICLPFGSKMEVEELISAIGGGAVNAAVTFSRQGFKTAAVFKIGGDFFGKEIISSLKKENIKIFSSEDKKNPTDYSTVIIGQNGDRTILVHRGASGNLQKKDIPSLKTKWLYIAPSNIPFSVINSVVSEAKKKGVMVAMNPSRFYLKIGLETLKPLLNKINVIIVNREEASILTGVSYNDEKAIFHKFDELINGVAVMTEGKNGGVVSDCCHIWRYGIFSNEKIIDATGAGDAFGSGFIAGLIKSGEECQKNACHSLNIEYAIRLGLANAASVVEKIGAEAGILTAEQFKSSRWRSVNIKTATL